MESFVSANCACNVVPAASAASFVHCTIRNAGALPYHPTTYTPATVTAVRVSHPSFVSGVVKARDTAFVAFWPRSQLQPRVLSAPRSQLLGCSGLLARLCCTWRMAHKKQLVSTSKTELPRAEAIAKPPSETIYYAQRHSSL